MNQLINLISSIGQRRILLLAIVVTGAVASVLYLTS
jgi:hypothetical protein